MRTSSGLCALARLAEPLPDDPDEAERGQAATGREKVADAGRAALVERLGGFRGEDSDARREFGPGVLRCSTVGGPDLEGGAWFGVSALPQVGRAVARSAWVTLVRVIGGFSTEGVAMRMHNPPHPGEIIKSLCLEPLGLTVTQAAEALGVSRKTLSAILNGRARVSAETAVRLSVAFGTSSESWLNQQTWYDLWHAERRRKKLRVAKLVPA